MNIQPFVRVKFPTNTPSQRARFSSPFLNAVKAPQFSGYAQVFDQYGITLKNVKLDLPHEMKLTTAEKRRLVLQAIKAYEHACKKRLLNEYFLRVTPDTKHISGRSFSSIVELQNGLAVPAVNSEFSRDDVLCGERSGIVAVINKALEKLDLQKLTSDPVYLAKAKEGLKVKRLIMSGAHRHTGVENSIDPVLDTITSPPPCSDCQAWLATAEYFDHDTQIVTLHRDKSRNFTLKIQTLGQLLPFWGDKRMDFTLPTPNRQESDAILRQAKPLNFVVNSNWGRQQP